MRRVFWWAGLPLRLVWGLSKGVFVAAALALFALNIATVTISGAFAAVSGAVAAVTGLSTVRQTMDARAARLAGQNRVLARQVEASTVTYRGERMAARRAVSDTSRRVSRRATRVAVQNVGSMAGEALPFVGIAVIVGATAWEMKESCDMMKDLRELDAAFNPDDPISEEEVCGMDVPSKAEIWDTVTGSPAAVLDGTRAMYDGLPDLGATYDSILGWGGRWFGAGEAEVRVE